MLGTKLYKNNKSDMSEYTPCAVWCNANSATIEDKGEYYEVVENVPYTPSQEEQIATLDSQYEQDKKTLQSYYVEFMIAGNAAGIEAIKQELADLAGQYDADLATLKGGE